MTVYSIIYLMHTRLAGTSPLAGASTPAPLAGALQIQAPSVTTRDLAMPLPYVLTVAGIFASFASARPFLAVAGFPGSRTSVEQCVCVCGYHSQALQNTHLQFGLLLQVQVMMVIVCDKLLFRVM